MTGLLLAMGALAILLLVLPARWEAVGIGCG